MQRLTGAPARPPPLASRGFVQRCVSYWGPVLFMSDGEFVETAGMDGLVSRDGRHDMLDGCTACFMGACCAAGCSTALHGAPACMMFHQPPLLCGLLHLQAMHLVLLPSPPAFSSYR